MKLLLDHNLSHKLCARLADLYAESSHTRFLDFERAVWLPHGQLQHACGRGGVARQLVKITALAEDPERVVLELFD